MILSDFYCEEVLSGRTPVQVVTVTTHVLAFPHTRPSYPTHIVVIPKRHISSLLALEEADHLVLLELLSVVGRWPSKRLSSGEPAVSSPTAGSIRIPNTCIGMWCTAPSGSTVG